MIHGIPWNSMELRLIGLENSMEFHGIRIPWNSVNSWNFMKFGFDRV
jgi:hypothetical protein